MFSRSSRRQRSSTVDARFERLVEDYGRSVATYARSVASTPTIAEDAVQETFFKAWRYLDSFRGTGSQEGWLIRICRNAIYDLEAKERRTIRAAPTALPDRDPMSLDVADPIEIDQLARYQVTELLDQLPLLQREVVVLCGLLGYSYEAAADILDSPVGTVRSRLSRARTTLRALECAVEHEAEPEDRQQDGRRGGHPNKRTSSSHRGQVA